MEFTATHLVVLVIGAGLGAGVVWLLTRTKTELAYASGRSEGEVERTSLSAQLTAANQKTTESASVLAEAERERRLLHGALEEVRTERAQLAERTSRLTEVSESLHRSQQTVDQLKEELAAFREANGGLLVGTADKEKRIAALEEREHALSSQCDSLKNERSQLKETIAELNSTLESERGQAAEKLALLADAKEGLSNEFKALAADIMEEKSKKFAEQNQVNLSQILAPLKEKLTSFQAKVEEVYVQETKERSALAEQVKALTLLNTTLSEDAQNLTIALTGNRKAQGGFGEMLLDDVLERAGLCEGQHFDRQGAVKSDDGLSYVIPDVVIHMPGDRHLVVDSKFTLPHYRTFSSAQTDEDRQAALKAHLIAVRAHVKSLSEKNYQSLYGLRSLDFVVMFVPLEPAFMVAVTNDPEIFHDAWQRNVILVSPSTLLFVIRTVANLWRQEDLSRNAREISSRGAQLYDKLVGFVEDLQKVGERIQQAQDSFNDARRKLSEGQGNAIRQAEMLKQLGVKPTKTMPVQLVRNLNERAEATAPLSLGSAAKVEVSGALAEEAG